MDIIAGLTGYVFIAAIGAIAVVLAITLAVALVLGKKFRDDDDALDLAEEFDGVDGFVYRAENRSCAAPVAQPEFFEEEPAFAGFFEEPEAAAEPERPQTEYAPAQAEESAVYEPVIEAQPAPMTEAAETREAAATPEAAEAPLPRAYETEPAPESAQHEIIRSEETAPMEKSEIKPAESVPMAQAQAPAQTEPAAQASPEARTVPRAVFTPSTPSMETPAPQPSVPEPPANVVYVTPSLENPIREDAAPADQRQGNWENYDGVYVGYYYDPTTALYYEGVAPVEIQRMYLPPAEHTVVKKVSPAAPLMDRPKSLRVPPRFRSGFDEAAIYGLYVIESAYGDYFFTLYSNKGEPLYESYNYASLEYCRAAIKRFKKHVVAGAFTVEQGPGGYHYKLLRNASVYDGPEKATRAEAEESIRTTKYYAQTSIVRVSK